MGEPCFGPGPCPHDHCNEPWEDDEEQDEEEKESP